MFQLNTVNKVIQLLIVGTATLLSAAFWSWPLYRGWMIKNSTLCQLALPISSLITGLLLLLPIAISVGLLVDGISGMTLRLVLDDRALRYAKVIRFLRLRAMADRYAVVKTIFEKSLEQHKKLNAAIQLGKMKSPPEYLGTFAVTFLFQSSPKEAIDWGVQHHSLHLLASNLMIVVLISTPFGLFASASMAHYGTAIGCLGGAIVVLAIFARASCYYALYAIEVAFRHAIIILSEPSKTDEKERTR
jgi:hypothetical protein